MLININDISKNESKDLNFSVEKPFHLISPDSKAKILFKGSLTNTDGVFHLLGDCSVDINSSCGVCLEFYTEKLSFPVDEVFSKEQFGESLYFEGKQIDIYPAIESNIVLNLPMRHVCSEDCKGLCKVCGCNLNTLDCGCDRDFIDPRFADLLTLIENKEV